MTPANTSDTSLSRFPARIQALVKAELDDDEEITWVGRPNPWRSAIKGIPMALGLVIAFGLFWLLMSHFFNEPILDAFFVLMELTSLSMPFWMMRSAKMTGYVLTTERAIIFHWDFVTRIRSVLPRDITDLRRTERADGSGDLILKREVITTRDERGNRGEKVVDVGFLAIPDVKEVEDLVRQLVD